MDLDVTALNEASDQDFDSINFRSQCQRTGVLEYSVWGRRSYETLIATAEFTKLQLLRCAMFVH